ncbi:hypothetical protein [Gracilibacillus orientalis]|nr:hypothetical protein [Gracilibacillus orientalis]
MAPTNEKDILVVELFYKNQTVEEITVNGETAMLHKTDPKSLRFTL